MTGVHSGSNYSSKRRSDTTMKWLRSRLILRPGTSSIIDCVIQGLKRILCLWVSCTIGKGYPASIWRHLLKKVTAVSLSKLSFPEWELTITGPNLHWYLRVFGKNLGAKRRIGFRWGTSMFLSRLLDPNLHLVLIDWTGLGYLFAWSLWIIQLRRNHLVLFIKG